MEDLQFVYRLRIARVVNVENLILGANRRKSLDVSDYDIVFSPKRVVSQMKKEKQRGRKNFVHVYVPEMLKRLFRKKSLAR